MRTNAKEAQEACGDLLDMEIINSHGVDNYNDNLGWVDFADQQCSYNNTQLTSFCTWWPTLFWASDTMVTNS